MQQTLIVILPPNKNLGESFALSPTQPLRSTTSKVTRRIGDECEAIMNGSYRLTGQRDSSASAL